MNFSNKKIHKDINIKSYTTLLKLIRDNQYSAINFNKLNDYDKFIILRHDVDICLYSAYEMSKIENNHGINSTYFVMLHNPLYNALSNNSICMLKDILNMGHSIGLHFDPSFYEIKTKNEFYKKIILELSVLSNFLDSKIYYISFHQPSPYNLDDEYFFKGEFESVYNKKYFKDIHYISDSCGNWKEESIIELIKTKRKNKIQFNSHPGLYFNHDHQILKDRLKAAIAEQSQRKEDDLRAAVNNYNNNIILYE
tara:strand:- start:225 stop:983 length:759 start_codon:yes stop_codon:yes gene_type:complete